MNMNTIRKSAAARRHVRRIAVTALAAASVLLMTNVHATDAIPQTTVRFGDLDLSKQQHAQELYSRLKHASRSVCRQFEGRSTLDMKLYAGCYEEALSTAVDHVGNSTLSALHAANPAVRVAERRTQGTPAS
jgi:UrcA family protein